MRRTSWLLRLLWSWVWNLQTISLLTQVNGLSLSLQKTAPAGEPVDGNRVELRCIADFLETGNNVIEWARLVMDTEVILARNGMSLATGFSVESLPMSTMRSISINETLVIERFNRQQNGFYLCRVKDSDLDSSSVLFAQTYYLAIPYYFPNASYPICFPDGPFTVQEGAIQNMSCTTVRGSPTVLMQIMTSDIWMYLDSGDKITRSMELAVSASDNGTIVQCRITSNLAFPDMERSCTIGPMIISSLPSETTINPSTPHSLDRSTDIFLTPAVSQPDQSTNQPVCQPSSLTDCVTQQTLPWIATSAVSLILFIVSFIINIFLLRRIHLKSFKEKRPNEPEAEPYTGLQPRDDLGSEYTEPGARRATEVEHA